MKKIVKTIYRTSIFYGKIFYRTTIFFLSYTVKFWILPYGKIFYRTVKIKDYFLTITERNFHLNFHQTSAFLGVKKWKLPVLKWNLRVFKGRKLETSSFEGWKLPQKRWKFWLNFHFWNWKFTRSLLRLLVNFR